MKTYDSKLDNNLFEREVFITDPYSKSSFKQKFVVRVMSYAGGKPKVEVKRLCYGSMKSGEYIKTGRFTSSELEDLIPVFNECLDFMNNNRFNT